MKRALLFILALLLLGAITLGVIIWRYPLAVFAWNNRRTLTNAGFTRATTETPVGPQVALEAGNGQTIVFLHGAGDQAGTWSQVAPAFTRDHHVVLLDLPGHGDSAPATGPLAMSKLLSGAEAVLNRQRGPMVLVGNSLGAWVAMLYARQHPQEVARVVAVDGGPLRGDRPELAKLPANREEAARMFDAVLDAGTPRPPGFVLDDVVRQANHGPMARMVTAREDLMKHVVEDLGDTNVPVDLLWGESDELVPLEYAKKMQAQLPAVRLTTIPRCGHVPQQECPRSFRRALETILSEPAPERKPPAVGTAK